MTISQYRNQAPVCVQVVAFVVGALVILAGSLAFWSIMASPRGARVYCLCNNCVASVGNGTRAPFTLSMRTAITHIKRSGSVRIDLPQGSGYLLESDVEEPVALYRSAFLDMSRLEGKSSYSEGSPDTSMRDLRVFSQSRTPRNPSV